MLTATTFESLDPATRTAPMSYGVGVACWLAGSSVFSAAMLGAIFGLARLAGA